MNINKQEESALISQKLREGKPLEIALDEIKRDKKFIKDHSKILKEKRDEIKSLQKEKERLEKQIIKINSSDKKDKEFKKEFKWIENNPPRSNGHCAVFQLNRIINYLKEFGETSKSKIYKDCLMDNKQFEEGASFLIKLGVLDKKINNGVTFYFINNERR
jgi:septal ring factor EnvC (AmiA/AmiB activator)